jgi:hypothetical protein
MKPKRHCLQAESGFTQNESTRFHYLLPDGLFTHFQGMEATGSFDYKLTLLIINQSTGF